MLLHLDRNGLNGIDILRSAAIEEAIDCRGEFGISLRYQVGHLLLGIDWHLQIFVSELAEGPRGFARLCMLHLPLQVTVDELEEKHLAACVIFRVPPRRISRMEFLGPSMLDAVLLSQHMHLQHCLVDVAKVDGSRDEGFDLSYILHFEWPLDVVFDSCLDSLKRGRQMLASTAESEDKIQCFMCLA